VIADLEDVCDHLVLLGAGRVQVAGEIEAVLGGHRLLTGPRDLADRLPGSCAVVSSSLTDRQASLLVRCGEPVHDPRWSARPVGLEELVLAYMRRPDAIALPGPALAAVGEPDDRPARPGGVRVTWLAWRQHRGEVLYHLASRFWQFQTIEGGTYLLLAAALTAFAFWWTTRRVD